MLGDSVLSQKRSHNQMALVSRLPIEVLGEIFGYLQLRTHKAWVGIHKPGYIPSLPWIPETTHVCHAWREVALHTTFLWQKIDVTVSPTWALEFASRSKNAPLCITASNSEIETDEKMHRVICSCTEQIVQASVERVQKIKLDDFSIPSILRILSPHTSPADERVTFPVLQHLEVSTFNLLGLILTDDSLCAPSLTSLEVGGFCSVDWKAFSLLQNLSHLTLTTFWDESVADLDAMHKALCQMPNLEGLTICPAVNTIGPEAIIPPAPDQTVALPKLRSINLSSYFPLWLSSMLHCIACGPQRDLSIFAILRDATDIKTLSSNIPSIFQQHIKESTILSSRIQFFDGCVSLSVWRFLKMPGDTVGPINIKVDLSPEIQLPTWYPFGLGVYLLNHLLPGFNFRPLTSLSLVFSVPIPVETWILFGSLPNLLMVDIQLGLRELCAALANDIEATLDHSQLASTTDHHIIPCRVLESITVWQEKAPLDIGYIRTCLRKRLDLKVPLKELRITFKEDGKDHDLDVGSLRGLVEYCVVAESSK